MVEDVAKTIISVNGNRNIISEMGARASHRIAMNYTEENYRRTVNAIYLKLVSCKENIR
jgi:hypothetical protein